MKIIFLNIYLIKFLLILKCNLIISEDFWVEQKLDHFDPAEKRTWKMKYVKSDTYFKNGGPIFILIGLQEEIVTESIKDILIKDLTMKYNAYLFHMEHRFYGKSLPLPDLSVESFKYLTIKQVLGDIKAFIDAIKKTYKEIANSKVVLFGSAYSAALVTWFQRIYPNVAAGSYASSAPLLAKLDFKEYFEGLGESIKSIGGDKCYDIILGGFKKIKEFLDTEPNKVAIRFNLCDGFDAKNEFDRWTLFYRFSLIFGDIVEVEQYQFINIVCKKIIKEQENYEGVFDVIKDYDFGSECNNLSYKYNLELIKNPINEESTTDRIVFYQHCSELGWFQTSTSEKNPFYGTPPLKYYEKFCQDAFGEKYTLEYMQKNIDETNKVYGGLRPNVKNVIFTHGKLDPWRLLGVQDNVIPLYGQSQDLFSMNYNDTKEMRKLKRKVSEDIGKWLT